MTQRCLLCGGPPTCGCVSVPVDVEHIRELLTDEYSGEFGLPTSYAWPMLAEIERLRQVAEAARDFHDEGDDPVDADCVRLPDYEAARKRLGEVLFGLTRKERRG